MHRVVCGCLGCELGLFLFVMEGVRRGSNLAPAITNPPAPLSRRLAPITNLARPAPHPQLRSRRRRRRQHSRASSSATAIGSSFFPTNTLPQPRPRARRLRRHRRTDITTTDPRTLWPETTSAPSAARPLLVPSMSLAICDPVRVHPYQPLSAALSRYQPPAVSSDATFHFQTLAIVPTNVSTAVTNLLEGTVLASLPFFRRADVVPTFPPLVQ
jgi:hypothetical protein